MLSEHFTLEEFQHSAVARVHGIDNTVPLQCIPALQQLCHTILEPLREFVKSFAAYSSERATVVAAREAREMIENWPTPKHTDDKTIVCLITKESEDE